MQDGIFYLFDCMDGEIGGQLFTAEQLRELMTGKREPYTERELKQIAANYEATLYRYEYKNGEPTSEAVLYDCFACFG